MVGLICWRVWVIQFRPIDPAKPPQEIGRALASTCLPAVIARQLQPSTQQQGGNSGSGSDNLSTALAFVEMARAFLAPLLAKDEAAAE